MHLVLFYPWRAKRTLLFLGCSFGFLGCGRGIFGCLDTLEQNTGRFVAGVLGNELAGKGVFEDRLAEGVQAGAQGLRLLQPGVQGFGSVEGEHPAGTGARVAQVAEKGLVTGGLVIEAEDGVPLGQMLGQLQHVRGRLFGHAGEGHALPFGFDHPGGLAVDEQLHA